ncbi:MAG: cytochrome c oxidase subunit II [Bacteroidetes bacterium]|nr:cytochrome c oxidase subunit II [Bacteroidota bacterium]MCB9044360.1 cytochrome c oxidase subunit II [Chitinophagales bacterium]
MISILAIISVFLIIVILFQVSKIAELVTEVKGEEEAIIRNNNLQANLFIIFLVVGMIAAVWSAIHYSPLFLPASSSAHGAWIENMFFWTWMATIPVFFITHVLLFWFVYKYKGQPGKLAYYFSHSNKLEILWTSVPAAVMIALVVVGMNNWYKITGTAPDDAVVIEATGMQFKWDLRYAGKDNVLGKKSVRLISDANPFGQDWEDQGNMDDFLADTLHLPLNKPVLMRINALDVLHSFYLAHFSVKMDAVPGIPTQFWFVPTKTTRQMREELNNPEFNYELACAELCGSAHYNMRKVVVVDTEEDFNKWLAAQSPISTMFGPNAKTAENTTADTTQTNITSL